MYETIRDQVVKELNRIPHHLSEEKRAKYFLNRGKAFGFLEGQDKKAFIDQIGSEHLDFLVEAELNEFWRQLKVIPEGFEKGGLKYVGLTQKDAEIVKEFKGIENALKHLDIWGFLLREDVVSIKGLQEEVKKAMDLDIVKRCPFPSYMGTEAPTYALFKKAPESPEPLRPKINYALNHMVKGPEVEGNHILVSTFQYATKRFIDAFEIEFREAAASAVGVLAYLSIKANGRKHQIPTGPLAEFHPDEFNKIFSKHLYIGPVFATSKLNLNDFQAIKSY